MLPILPHAKVAIKFFTSICIVPSYGGSQPYALNIPASAAKYSVSMLLPYFLLQYLISNPFLISLYIATICISL